jgi:putative DNA primase/helicase
MTARPIDVVRNRLHVVHGVPPKIRARCPVHGSHGGTLAITEARDGTVLLHCHFGCQAGEIVHAIGLELRDLFPDARAMEPRARNERRPRTRADVERLVRAEAERIARQEAGRLE